MATERLNLEDVINQAKQLLEGGDPDSAILLCRHVFHYYPRCLEATRVMGEAYTEKRLLDEADQLFIFVLAADPHDVLGYVDRGFIACERGHFDEAIVYYERALELDPNIEQLRIELLRLYREQYGNSRAKLRLTKSGLAHHRMRDGFYSQAIEEYNAILRETPSRLDIQVALMEAYWRNRDYPRAERLALDLLEDHPFLIKANLILWHIYGVRRRQDKAAGYLEKAHALDPLNLVAERLFEDSMAADDALNYIAMLGVAAVPAPNWEKLHSEAENAPLLPAWVTSGASTDFELGLKEPEPVAEEPAEAATSLKGLGDNNKWLQRLLDESDDETLHTVPPEVQQLNVPVKDEEGFAQLEELRNSEELSFDSLFEEVAQPLPEISMPQEPAKPAGGDEFDLGAFEAFDNAMSGEPGQGFELEQFNPENLGPEPEKQETGQPFVFNEEELESPAIPEGTQPLEATAQTGPANGELSDFFEEEEILPFSLETAGQPGETTVEPSTNEADMETGQFDLDFNLEELKPAEPLVSAPAAEVTAAPPAGETETQVPVGELDDDSFLKSLLGDGEATPGEYDYNHDLLDEESFAQQQENQNAIAVESWRSGPLEEHAFHKRDERGPIPDFVGEAEPAAQAKAEPAFALLDEESELEASDFPDFNELDNLLISPEYGVAEPAIQQEAAPAPEQAVEQEESGVVGNTVWEGGLEDVGATASNPKELEDMPIKKGRPEEDTDVFDWEKEELPDYLQAFAMDEEEAEKFGLNAPIADVSTSPARIRPREDTGGLPGDLPDWLSPTAGRQAGAPRGNMMDMGTGQQAPTGDLPNWLDKTLEGQGETAAFQPPASPFGMEDLKPFNPEEPDAFGGPSLQTPQFQPPPKAPESPQPFSPTERAFSDMPDFGDEGDLKPFSFDDLDAGPGAGGFAQPTPPPPPARPAPQPPKQQPAAPFGMPGMDDLGDLEPFNPFDDSGPTLSKPATPPVQPTQPAQSWQAGTNQPTAPFSIPGGKPASPMDDFGFDDLQPFSINESPSAPEAPSAPEPSFNFNPAGSQPGFNDMGNMKLSDLEPFKLDDFDIGASAPPTGQRPPAARPGAKPAGGEPTWNLPDDMENFDLEPFSGEGLDIPGLGGGPASMRPDPNAYTAEPFYPAQSRRPRETEPEIEVEPGQEKPLRRFSWLEERRKRSKPVETDKFDSPFARMAARRKQQEDENLRQRALNPEPEKPFLPEDLEQENLEDILPFEEVERLASMPEAEEAAQTPVQETAFQAEPLSPEELDLNLNIDSEAFNRSLDESLASAAPSESMEDFWTGFEQSKTQQQPEQESFGFGEMEVKPFDLSELATEKEATPPTAPQPVEMPEEEAPQPFSFEPEQPTSEAQMPEMEVGPQEPALEPFSFDLDQAEAEPELSGLEFGAPATQEPEKQAAEPEPFSFDLDELGEAGKEVEPFNFDFNLPEEAAGEPEPFSFDLNIPEEPAGQPEPFTLDLGGLEEPARPQEPAAFEQSVPEETAAEPEPFSLDLGSFEESAKETEPFSFNLEEFQEPAAPPAPEVQMPAAEHHEPLFGEDLDFFAGEVPDFGQAPSVEPETARPVSKPAEEAPKLMSYEEAAREFGISFGQPETAPAAEEEAMPPSEELLDVFAPEVAPGGEQAPAFEPAAEEVAQPFAEEAPAPVMEQPVAEAAPEPEVAQPAEEAPPEVPAVTASEPAAAQAAESVDMNSFLQKVKENPRDLSANLNLGNAYFEQQEYAQALNYYAASVKIADKDTLNTIVNKLQNIATTQESNPRFHRVLGDAYMKQGYYHWALSEYSKALGPKK